MSDQYEHSFYFILGLSSRASDDEIEAAYRRLSRQFHPDSSNEPDAEERYKLINWAYSVIGRDPVARSEYDQQCKARAGCGSLRFADRPDGSWVEQVRTRILEADKDTEPALPRRRWKHHA